MDMSSIFIGIDRENREDKEQYDSKFTGFMQKMCCYFITPFHISHALLSPAAHLCTRR